MHWRLEATEDHSSLWAERERPVTTTIEGDADTLEDVLPLFEQLLRGAGYYYDGSLEIVPDETGEPEDWHEVPVDDDDPGTTDD